MTLGFILIITSLSHHLFVNVHTNITIRWVVMHGRSSLVERFVWLIPITNETLACLIGVPSAIPKAIYIILPTNIQIFLEGQAAFSRTRLSDNRSVMPLDVRSHTHGTLKKSACFFPDQKARVTR